MMVYFDNFYSSELQQISGLCVLLRLLQQNKFINFYIFANKKKKLFSIFSKMRKNIEFIE